MILAVFLIMAQPSVSNAETYSGAWLPNDTQDFFAVEFTFGSDQGSFSMYDWNDSSNSLEIFSVNDSFGAKSVFFTQSNSTWYAGLTEGALTFDPGDDLLFGFFFGDGTNEYCDYDLKVVEMNEVYRLSHESSDIIIVTSDVQAVPIPASALLLGSGMVGLIGFGKRMRKKVS